MVIKKQTTPLDNNKTMISFIRNSVTPTIKKTWLVRFFLLKKRIKGFFSKKETKQDRIEESLFLLRLIVRYAESFKKSFIQQGDFLKEELRVLSCDCSKFCQTRSLKGFIEKTNYEFFNSFGFYNENVQSLVACYDCRPMNELYHRTPGSLIDQLLLKDNKLQELRRKFFREENGFFLLEEKLITQALVNYYDLKLTQEDKKTTKGLTIDEQELFELLDRITIKSMQNGEYLILNTESLVDWMAERYRSVCCEEKLTVFLKELLIIARKGNRSKELLFLLTRGDVSHVMALKKHSSYWNPLLFLVQCLLDTEELNQSELKTLKRVIEVHKENTFGLSGHNKALRLLYKKHPKLRFFIGS